MSGYQRVHMVVDGHLAKIADGCMATDAISEASDWFKSTDDAPWVRCSAESPRRPWRPPTRFANEVQRWRAWSRNRPIEQVDIRLRRQRVTRSNGLCIKQDHESWAHVALHINTTSLGVVALTRMTHGNSCSFRRLRHTLGVLLDSIPITEIDTLNAPLHLSPQVLLDCLGVALDMLLERPTPKGSWITKGSRVSIDPARPEGDEALTRASAQMTPSSFRFIPNDCVAHDNRWQALIAIPSQAMLVVRDHKTGALHSWRHNTTPLRLFEQLRFGPNCATVTAGYSDYTLPDAYLVPD